MAVVGGKQGEGQVGRRKHSTNFWGIAQKEMGLRGVFDEVFHLPEYYELDPAW